MSAPPPPQPSGKRGGESGGATTSTADTPPTPYPFPCPHLSRAAAGREGGGQPGRPPMKPRMRGWWPAAVFPLALGGGSVPFAVPRPAAPVRAGPVCRLPAPAAAERETAI